LKLAHKIYLVIAICTIPLIGLAIYFSVRGFNKDITFAQMELYGNEYMRPLSTVMEHVSQHYVLTHRTLIGDKSVSTQQIAEVRNQVGKDIDRLFEVDRKIGQTLQFTEQALKERKRPDANVENLKKEWSGLVAQADTLTIPTSRAKHEGLIKIVRDMISHAGDKSFLILDPDLDSYYMMDITLVRMPVAQERLVNSLTFGIDAAIKEGLATKETRTLDTYASVLRETDRDNVTGDMQTALDEDKNFYGSSPTLANARQKVEAFATSVENYAKLLETISSEKADVKATRLVEAGEQARRDSYALWNSAVDELDTLLKIRTESIQRDRMFALIVAAVILILALLISAVVIRTITSSVENLSKELHELAQGDANLTRRVTAAGSLELVNMATSFNSLMGKLLELIKQIQQSGTQVTSSSNEIAASTKQLEAAVTEQAASTNEVVATTKEISATSQTLVQTMGDVSKMASDTAGMANSAQGDLDGMEGTMRQLATSTASISTKLAAISEKANNINKIVITITKVADQTNLLSLNASIEAEKAGEHGLGFAVVAREIRRLADQTAVATLDIERMVKEMQSAVSVGVMEMDKFTRDVGRGVDDVNQIGTQLNKMMEHVQNLSPRFETVTEGMQAQSQGAQQITTAMVQLSDAARQTMESLRQTNSAIMDLNTAAHGLHDEVTRFRTAAG
jgi:methyl-accepting chemotaxis protein